MNRLDSMMVPSQLCVFPTQYNVVFISNGKVQFNLSLEDRINHVKILHVKSKAVKVRGAQYHGQLLFVMDQLLNWSIFGFAVGNGSYQNRMREVQSCREHSLFDYVSQVTHKSRRRMKSFVNLRRDGDMWVLDMQLSVCQQWTTILTMKETPLGIDFDSQKRDISKSLLFYGNWSDRQLVMSKTYDICLMDKSLLIDSSQYITRLNVYRTDGYSLYMLIVNKHTLETHVGKVILCSIDQPIDIFLKDKQIFLFGRHAATIYHMDTQQSQQYKCSPLVVTQSQDVFRFVDMETKCLMQMNSNGDMKILKNGMGGIVQILEADREYAVDESGSVTVIAGDTVYQNDTVRILSATSISDQYGSSLRIVKKIGQTIHTAYVSSQPHCNTLLRMNHDMIIDKIWHVGNTMVISSPIIGTCFIQHTIDNNKFKIVNAPQKYQQETMCIGMLEDNTIQVTQTTILVNQLKADTSTIFDNLQVTIDHAVIVNKYLILVVCQQLYLLTLRKKKDPKDILQLAFIYCLDSEVETIFGSMDTLSIKMVNNNSITMYKINKIDQTLQHFYTIDSTHQLLIKNTYILSVTINGQQYSLTIVIRMYDYPLIIFHSHKHTFHTQFRVLPLHKTMQLVQVNTDDTDKCKIWSYVDTLLAADTYLYIPRIVSAQDMVVQCMKCHGMKEQVIAATIINGMLLRITHNEYILSQQRHGIYQQRRVSSEWKIRVVDNVTSLTIPVQSIIGADENYSKIHTVEVYKTQIVSGVGRLQLNGRLSHVKMLSGSIFLLYGVDEVWLCRILVDQQMILSVYSKFSYVNEGYSQFQHKIPRSDLEVSLLMEQFRQRHPIIDIGSLDLSKSFTQADNYIFILFQKIILVLQLDRLVIKIHQHINLDQPINCILDNYAPGAAFLRGNNYIYVLERESSDKFGIQKSLEVDDTIVFATRLSNWTQKGRKFRIGECEAMVEETSLLLVKEYGQLEIETKDQKGVSHNTQTYL